MTLITRIVEGEGADRELDARIHHHFSPEQEFMLDSGDVRTRRPAKYGTLADFNLEGWEGVSNWEALASAMLAPLYTSSVDAALAFAERMLPGWDFEVGTREKDDDENEASWYVRLTKGDYPYERIASASHKEFARAIFATTLKAKEPK